MKVLSKGLQRWLRFKSLKLIVKKLRGFFDFSVDDPYKLISVFDF